jgi:glucosyl-3-phosphoglycerate synthase
LKEQQGLVISCCVPTLNEAATITKVIRELKKCPLLDLLAVVDSGSSDHTLELAAAAGADVYVASDIRPEFGPAQGKGENLWKSLHVLRGDIIVYIDGDLRNPHPRFVAGLVGPLLSNRNLHYVKAFYDRPGGGGRVTEILARPLLRQFFPALADLRQPLAGEYAARRTLLEQLPFPVGYSVEVTHLIDIAQKFGASALAQADLGRRLHRTRPLDELSQMSEGILRSVLSRLHAQGRWAEPVEAEMERPAMETLNAVKAVKH